MARRRGDRARDPAARDTTTLQQREFKSTARRMVDGGQDVDVARPIGSPPAVVHVTHMAAPVSVLRGDPVLLKLREDEAPDAARWPNLPGVEARAVTDGMVPAVAARLVAVLLEVGAALVVELDIACEQPHAVATHEGTNR